jgi:hypothetical protein
MGLVVVDVDLRLVGVVVGVVVELLGNELGLRDMDCCIDVGTVVGVVVGAAVGAVVGAVVWCCYRCCSCRRHGGRDKGRLGWRHAVVVGSGSGSVWW